MKRMKTAPFSFIRTAFVVFGLTAAFIASVFPQSAVERTNKIKVNISRHSGLPPRLLLDVKFEEPSGNQMLDAEEDAALKLVLTNEGEGTAYALQPKITFSNENIIMSEIPEVRSLGPKKSVELNAYLRTNKNLSDGKTTFSIAVQEAKGFNPPQKILTVTTQKQQFPNLILAGQAIDDFSKNRKIEQSELVTLTLRIQNSGGGYAKDVTAELEAGQNTFITEDTRGVRNLGTIESGDFRDVKYTFYTNSVASRINLTLKVSDASKLHGWQKPVDIPLDRVVNAPEELVIPGKKFGAGVPLASLSVDIEENIPETAVKNPNAIALIVAIQEYQSPAIPTVKFAKRDAAIMREYLIKAMGYDPKNILPRNEDELMTVGKIKTYVNQKLPSFLRPDGSSDLFIYYVGHGAPGTKEKVGYLVPHDCDPNEVSDDNAYNMRAFQNDVLKLSAKTKTVVIDACFSGQAGDGRMLLANASPIYITVDNELTSDPKTSIFLSSEAEQLSNWYPEKQHSMFTYFFLKGLKGDADADKDKVITIGEMEAYINDANNGLPYHSNREHQRPQRAVIVGPRERVLRQQ